MLQHLDVQLGKLSSHHSAPYLPRDVWHRLASTVYEEAASLPEATTSALRLSMIVPPERYLEELIAFQAWMEIASQNAQNPAIVRAQVMTELYVAFVWLRDSVLRPVSELVPEEAVLAVISKYLSTGQRRLFRNSIAHGRWCYLPDFSGIEYWAEPSPGRAHERFLIDQADLDCWQTLSRGTTIAVLLALAEDGPTRRPSAGP